MLNSSISAKFVGSSFHKYEKSIMRQNLKHIYKDNFIKVKLCFQQCIQEIIICMYLSRKTKLVNKFKTFKSLNFLLILSTFSASLNFSFAFKEKIISYKCQYLHGLMGSISHYPFFCYSLLHNLIQSNTDES